MDQQDDTIISDEGATVASRSFLPGCRFIIGASLMISVMVLLGSILWQRVRQVDPLRRCAAAYKSSYTAVDTTLVDRIRVRTPDGDGRTTCGALREEGLVNHLPPEDRKRPFSD